jgi:8-oxo-dGTP pyrophosphatase MutT (NUDIX family)
MSEQPPDPIGHPIPRPEDQVRRIQVAAALDGRRVDVPLLHGEHPRAAALRAGGRLSPAALRVTGPPEEVGTELLRDAGRGVHVLRIGYRLALAGPAASTLPPGPARPAGPAPAAPAAAPAAGPVTAASGSAAVPRPALRDLPRVQRAAAYAVVLDADRVLLTRLTASALWTLPGGGIEYGETPVEAAVREVYEEAGLDLTPGALVDVDSIHFTGQAPDGRWEDYHGVRVVYLGAVPTGVRPRVVEVGGSTEEAAWVDRATLARLRLSGLARTMLGQHGFGVRA